MERGTVTTFMGMRTYFGRRTMKTNWSLGGGWSDVLSSISSYFNPLLLTVIVHPLLSYLNGKSYSAIYSQVIISHQLYFLLCSVKVYSTFS